MATSQLIGADHVQRQLRRLHQESEKTIRSGLARLAWEVRAAIQRDVAAKLEWSGPGTQKFIAGGFRLQYGTSAGVFSARIYPAPRAAVLLARHTQAHTNLPGKHADLELQGKIAVPIPAVIPRGRSGRVPARLRPAALLERDAKGRSRGFVTRSGKAIMYRLKSGAVVPAYGLRAQTSQQQRIDIPATARRAVHERAEAAFDDAIMRARRAAGIS